MLGKLVLASERMKAKTGVISLVITGGILIAITIFLIIMSFSISGNSSGDEIPADLVLMVCGIAVFAFAAILITRGAIQIKANGASFVDVYTNGVKGVSLGGISPDKKTQIEAQSFELPYKDISNVDISKDIVNVYTNYGKYRCAARNGEEIKNTILKLKNQGAQSQN